MLPLPVAALMKLVSSVSFVWSLLLRKLMSRRLSGDFLLCLLFLLSLLLRLCPLLQSLNGCGDSEYTLPIKLLFLKQQPCWTQLLQTVGNM